MRSTHAAIAVALGLMVQGVAPAWAARVERLPEASRAAEARAGAAPSREATPEHGDALLLPPVPRGRLHPDPGLYLVASDVGVPLCVRIDAPVEKAAALAESAVVLVHGLDDSGDQWRELAPALHRAGRTVLFFEYANDQGIALSADELGRALRVLRARGIIRVDLVCHSMGGLVARDVLTRPEHYAGVGDPRDGLPDVDRVILVATPNQGAPLAYIRAPNDLIERTIAWRHADAPLSEIFALGSDGDGQAGLDLRPGSAYLTELNARPAPTGVHTTVIVAQALGDAPEASEPDAKADGSGSGPSSSSERAPGVRARVRMWWSRVVRRVVEVLGDGAVPADSARLAHADETVQVRCTHVGLLKADPVGGWILGTVGQPAERSPAVSIVLERVSVSTP